MNYVITELARISGVSSRTLRHYEEIGLLTPLGKRRNGYREYGEEELLRLQQILFFRALGMPLEDIKQTLDDPGFDTIAALREHRIELIAREARLHQLIATVDKTIAKLNADATMADSELYDAFEDKDLNPYADEVKDRWGDSDAYRESRKKLRSYSKQEMDKLAADGEGLYKSIAATMTQTADSPAVQELIDRHFRYLHNFYTPSVEMYRGLGEMYIADERFAAYFEKIAPGMAKFMRDAIAAYCDSR